MTTKEPDITPPEFCLFLRKWRKSERKSQQQVADQAGLQQGTISAWEIGRQLPRNENDVITFAKKLGIDEEELLAIYWRSKEKDSFRESINSMSDLIVTADDLKYLTQIVEGLATPSIRLSLLLELLRLRKFSTSYKEADNASKKE